MEIKAKIPFRGKLRVMYSNESGLLRAMDFATNATDAEIIDRISAPNTGNKPGSQKAGDELEALRDEAKALGIKSPHLMKQKTLIAKIKAAKGE